MSSFLNRRWPELHNLLPTSQSQDAKIPQGADKRRYSMLPTSLPRRYARLVLAFLVAFGFLYSFNGGLLSTNSSYSPSESVPYPEVQQIADSSHLPPLWDAYREYEDEISERELLRTNGSQRYIYFANHPWGCGWGNVLQEMVFGSLLASEANLGFVWDDYTWNVDGSKYSEYNGKPIPSRTPLSTMLSGHLLGLDPATTDGKDTSLPPRSISCRLYERICPQSERAVVSRNMVVEHLQATHAPYTLDDGSGMDTLNAWLSILETPAFRNAKCIEVDKSSPHVFDIWLLGSKRVHDIWDRLSRSPTLEHWTWSPLILGAFERNLHLLMPSKELTALSNSSSGFFSRIWNLFQPSKRLSYPPPISQLKDSASPADVASEIASNTTSRDPLIINDSEPLPILALHLRRGDFKEHCSNLAEWSSSYTGINSFPQFRVRDSFNVPRIGNPADSNPGNAAADQGPVLKSMEEVKRFYARHCIPEVDEIVSRVRDIVHDYVKFAEERERAQTKAWWSWDGAAKEGGEGLKKESVQGAGAPSQSQDGAYDLDRRGSGKELRSVKGRALPRKVFIMTNGDREWLAEVKQALMEDAARSQTASGSDSKWEFKWEWEDVVTSRDLQLGWEEKPIAQVLDSYISQRAEVFVGNGFSSLTSNVVMLRVKKGFDPVQTRFW